MTSTMRALVRSYRGAASASRPLPPIPRGWVLLRVLSAAWTPLEDAVASGAVWVEPERVMGFCGAGLVVELGVDAPKDLGGKRVVLGSAVEHGGKPVLPGLTIDGWLAEYASLPSDCLEVLDEPLEPELGALTTIAGVAWSAAEILAKTEGKACIVGAGITGLLASYSAKIMGREVVVYGARLGSVEKRLARELGIPLAEASSMTEHAATFVSTLFSTAVDKAVERTSRGGLVLLHPAYLYVPPPRARRVRVELVERFSVHAGARVLKEVWSVIKEVGVGVVRGLEPPPLPAPRKALVYLVSPP